MLVFRRILAALAFSAPLLLVAPRAAHQANRCASFSVAQAQSAVAPARIELYLPPARIAPPVAVPLPGRRAAPRPAPPPDPEEARFGRLDREARITRGRFREPGLFTVSRLGYRLRYRKGYLGD